MEQRIKPSIAPMVMCLHERVYGRSCVRFLMLNLWPLTKMSNLIELT